jgi:ankyrin repeat protein
MAADTYFGTSSKKAKVDDTMHAAAKRNDAEAIRILSLTGEHDINQLTMTPDFSEEVSPLYVATMLHNNEVVHALIISGANPNIGSTRGMPPLILATMLKNHVLIRQLIAAGADVNIHWGGMRQTALITAASQNDVAAIQILLFDGHADINKLDHYGSTALIYASRDGSMDAFRSLFRNGADENIRNQLGLGLGLGLGF